MLKEIEEIKNELSFLKRCKITATYSTYLILSKTFNPEKVFTIMNCPEIRNGYDYDTIKEIDKIGIDKYTKEQRGKQMYFEFIKDDVIDPEFKDLSKK